MRLKGKLAVITAAASGMGKAGVELFVREGATVAAIDINEGALNDLAATLGSAVIPVVADLSTVDGVKASIAAAAERLGGIDVMWAHAGIPGPASVEDMDLDQYDLAIALNLTSAVVAAGEVARHMRARGGGSLIFTASVSGLVGSMFSPVYSAAKFGVVGLTKSLAQRFAPDGIRVNVVCPGPIDTPMLPGFVARGDDTAQAAENERKLLGAVPLGRVGKPSEVAHAGLWLASDDSSYVTGVALPVDGGFLSR
ncbi:NAD(P)-dependent dehydrogenase (short-subunit alcohol dehydrogenase family) [Azospirillum agricola]|uniref:SDR family NAD(P)-dependent oxidoreductase n=1 Tax=Azospirillum agricola TaxID=1720247 RepID=UPI001AE8762D|nr:SDR family NAD(P)-dependent oxidoreductase [Azospirillum agricola]MBP2229420.1 NAD(P)-dependent dehydrogenase (short-subunit alcohol dehydrogenase family) [Azospirillum agricola]